MSLIGKRPIPITDKVKITVKEQNISVEGPKGRLEWVLPEDIKIDIKDNAIFVIGSGKNNKDKKLSSRHGLARAYINNMVKGVTEGYIKELEIQGVGYRAQVQGNVLNLQLGFSHPIDYRIPDGITIKTPKPNQIIVEGIDKAKVGEVAAEIRGFFEPEPYKGKGIRYVGEYVRKKAGKAVA